MGNWKTILQDLDLKFLDHSAVDLKDRHVVFISSTSPLRLSLCSTLFSLLTFALVPDRVVDRLANLLVATCHFNCIAVSISEILVFHDGDCVSFHF